MIEPREKPRERADACIEEPERVTQLCVRRGISERRRVFEWSQHDGEVQRDFAGRMIV